MILIFTCGIAAGENGTEFKSLLIDPGHSPKSPGTIGCNGKLEYLYNDTLAKAVVAFLKSKNIPTDLTRFNNENISLIARARKSNKRCLLLSFHHDSVQPQFLYGKSHIDGYCSKKAKGFSIFVSRKNPYYNESVQYAKALGVALLKRGLMPTLHHAEPIAGENRELLMPDMGIYVFDELTILKNSQSPALLLEAAVIVHPQEALISDTDEYRRIIAEAVYEMLVKKHKHQ